MGDGDLVAGACFVVVVAGESRVGDVLPSHRINGVDLVACQIHGWYAGDGVIAVGVDVAEVAVRVAHVRGCVGPQVVSGVAVDAVVRRRIR